MLDHSFCFVVTSLFICTFLAQSQQRFVPNISVNFF